MTQASFNSASAPAELASIYRSAKRDAAAAGIDGDAVETAALRVVQHAGWYNTADGWKQLGPDVRGRVTVRRAIPQPDGDSLIADVLVFYPNAVKKDDAYDADNIREIVDNTNRMIQAGAQTVGIIRTHPHPIHKLPGNEQRLHGEAFNFREVAGRDGWIMCDLLVDAELTNEWANRQITGLSIGIYPDASGLNRRIGHVAALGAETQALSLLPRTELFSAERMVCFSADEETFSRGTKMPMNFSAAKSAFAAMSSAFASMEAKEPGADDKMKSAFAAFSSAFAEEPPSGNTGTGAKTDVEASPIPPVLPKEQPGTYDANGGNEETTLPEETDLNKPGSGTGNSIDIAGTAGTASARGTFAAGQGSTFAARLSFLEKQNEQLTRQNNLMARAKLQGDFQNLMDTEKAAGRQFNPQLAGSTYSAILEGDRKTAVASLKQLLKSLPTTSLAAVGTLFAADTGKAGAAAAPAAGATDYAQIMAELGEAMPGKTFSTEQVQFGEGWQSKMWGKAKG